MTRSNHRPGCVQAFQPREATTDELNFAAAKATIEAPTRHRKDCPPDIIVSLGSSTTVEKAMTAAVQSAAHEDYGVRNVFVPKSFTEALANYPFAGFVRSKG